MLTLTKDPGKNKPFALKKKVVSCYEPPVFGVAPERRRYKFITFTEEDLKVTQRLAGEYWAMVREELAHRLVKL